MTLNTLAPTQYTNLLVSDLGAPTTLTQANNAAISALIEMKSTDGGFLITRVTTAQKNAMNPGTALMVFDTDLNQLQLYKNGAWGNVSTVLNFEDACYAASTANLNADYDNGVSGVGSTLVNAGALQTFNIDGVVPPLLSRILVKNQSNAFENGIYDLTEVGSIAVPWILTRAENYDHPDEINPGDFVLINNGTDNANTAWVQTATVAAIGVDSISFSQFSPASIPYIEIPAQNELFVGTDCGNTHGTSLRNTGFGLGEVLHSLSGGDDNSAYGFEAARDLTVGVNGCFFGSGAGRSNLSANSCGAFGYQALFNNTIQDNNLAFGDRALFALNDNVGISNNNIAIGQHAAQSMEDGQGNTYIGSQVASSGTTGNVDNVAVGRASFDTAENSEKNVCLGVESGTAFARYTECFFLGYQADATTNDLTNAGAIGTGAQISVDNAINIGNGQLIGINNPTPLYTLDIADDGNNVHAIRLGTQTAGTGIPSIGATDFGYIVYNCYFQTLNDTPAELNLISLPNDSSCTIEIIVNAADSTYADFTGGTAVGGYLATGGAATLVSANYSKIISSTGDFTLGDSTTFATLTLQGIAATTINWNITVKVLFN